MPGPDLKPPVSVTLKPPRNPQLCSLRVVAPGVFRQGFLSKDKADSPETVISALASLAPCKVSCLTGGRWTQTQDKDSKVLTAFLRVPQEVGEALAKVSGQKGLFCTVLDKHRDRQFSPIVWVPKQASASHEEYWRFALAQAQKQAKPLAFRQGGKSSLGIIDGAPDSFPHAPRARVFGKLQMSPRLGAKTTSEISLVMLSGTLMRLLLGANHEQNMPGRCGS